MDTGANGPPFIPSADDSDDEVAQAVAPHQQPQHQHYFASSSSSASSEASDAPPRKRLRMTAEEVLKRKRVDSPPQRDPDYYMSDGSCILLVDNVLFNVSFLPESSLPCHHLHVSSLGLLCQPHIRWGATRSRPMRLVPGCPCYAGRVHAFQLLATMTGLLPRFQRTLPLPPRLCRVNADAIASGPPYPARAGFVILFISFSCSFARLDPTRRFL